MRKISAEKTLLIWALAIVMGLLLFKLINRDLPGMSVSLVFGTWWEEELEENSLPKLINEFEAQNPGITVTLEKMSWDEIKMSLGETAAKPAENSGNAKNRINPDVFSIEPYDIHELENNSAGNVLPIIAFINPLFYNIDLLKAAGFDRPPKNQTEFLSYVQRLKETGVNGAGLAMKDPRSISSQFLSWIWAAADNPESAGSFNFNSKTVIETLSFLNKLYQNLYTNPLNLSEAELLEAFRNKQVGMMIGSIAAVQKLKSTDINFGITTIPSPESYTKKPVFALSYWYAGINSRCTNQEAAQKFLAFLKEKGETIAAAAYAIPGSGSRSLELTKSDPYYAKAFDMFEAGDTTREIYRSSNPGDLNNVIRREAELLFKGIKTPEQCVETIQQNWTKLAEENPASSTNGT